MFCLKLSLSSNNTFVAISIHLFKVHQGALNKYKYSRIAKDPCAKMRTYLWYIPEISLNISYDGLVLFEYHRNNINKQFKSRS